MLMEGLPAQFAPLSCQMKLWLLSHRHGYLNCIFLQGLASLLSGAIAFKEMVSFMIQVHPTQLYSWLIQFYSSQYHQTQNIVQVK